MDPTAADRVRKYRSAQKGGRNIARVEVQVPAGYRDDIKCYAAELRNSYTKLEKDQLHLDFALRTINAPRPHKINKEMVLKCLIGRVHEKVWQSHIQAFFDELSEEAIHDIVLTGAVDFEELYQAARSWGASNGKRVRWIKEMADLTLAAPSP